MPKKSNLSDIQNIRHSLAHLLAAAVMELWPDTKRAIGPAIETGFYYDFEFSKPISDEDLPKIEKKMKEILPSWDKFTRHELTAAQAKKEYPQNPYKHELIDEFSKGGKKKVSFYKSGNYWDLCRGGHVKSAKKIKPDAFCLTHLAGAYWKGSEKNPMLTRIYAAAFSAKKELNGYLKMQEEAKKRDHKKLGVELDLFTFSDLVGAGLPLFTPKGAIIRDLLDEFVWSLRQKHGYEKVDIPHIAKKELYQTSGHWDKFRNELFQITTREGHKLALKPMNCPHHIQILARKKWSFRELPQRYASTTKIYRDEQTGELSGLARVRSITQDDAHVFCNMAQTEDELKKIWEIVHKFYGAFNLPLKLRLSLREKKQPEKYLGDEKLWRDAEAILLKVAKNKKAKFFKAVGEAAFYGPKLDFMATDSLGREWQVATIQLDLTMPKRFNLTFTNDKGGQSQIVMIHAAIMGAIERFLAILIEHFAGAFPLWLAPVQVVILPISDEQNKYAQEIAKELTPASSAGQALTLSLSKRGGSPSFTKEGVGGSSGLRIEIDSRSESIGRKIREAELQKIPYMLIVGKKEKAQKTVSVRQRGEKDLGAMKLEKFAERIKREIEAKAL